MRNTATPLLFLSFLLLIQSCAPEKKHSVTSAPFGVTPEGEQVTAYTLANKAGVEMKVITYGGIITSLTIPDREGKLEDVVLGYDSLESYLKATPYFGAIIGRFGNRIAKGKFTLDSMEYTLAVNNIGNHLHGGIKGFDKVNWEAAPFETESTVGLKLTYTSPDMEEGYPGTMQAAVTYTLGDDNTLQFDYEATTDKKTVVNLTQHTYFNFSAMKADILDHDLTLNADRFLPVDSTLIPTGELRPVSGTPFDFTTLKRIGEDIAADDQQLAYGGGFDHCWVLNEEADALQYAATLYESASGRSMEIYTTEPAIQFYSGNFLDGTLNGKKGVSYAYRSGLCLETQHYPDSPNQPTFPTVVLNPGETYKSTTRLVFGVK